MKYINYKRFDVINGPGARVCLWVSRCSHCCKGCFNKDSWKSIGTEITEEFIQQVIEDINKPYIEGITLSGGDPVHRANLPETIELCRRIKKEVPNKSILVYTGYTISEMRENSLRSQLLETIDFLMDGKYECDNPTTKPWRGSNNQHLYHVIDGIPELID